MSSLGLNLIYKVAWGIEPGLLPSTFYPQDELLLYSRQVSGIIKISSPGGGDITQVN